MNYQVSVASVVDTNGRRAVNRSRSARPVKVLTGILPKGYRFAPARANIYGLFNRLGRCRYLGSTVQPESRAAKHRTTYGHALKFRIIRTCALHHAPSIERRLIRQYKAAGQCDLNRYISGHRMPLGGRAILWPAKQIAFASYSHAAQFFKCSSTTIANIFIRDHKKARIHKRNGVHSGARLKLFSSF